MIQIQWFQAWLLVLGIIVSAVVVIASYKRTTREQQEANNENWQSAVGALKAHNDALVDRLKDSEELQAQQTKRLGELEGTLKAFERDRNAWTRRNQYLYERCMEQREMLARLGHKTPEINGEG